jgi:hypothetical protein
LKDVNVESASGLTAGALDDGTFFAGQLDNNGKPDGVASFSYPDGSQYVGEVKSGVYEGSGRLTMPDGTLIEGMFKEGKPAGVVSVSKPDGSWMRGEYYGGAINGVGQIHKKDAYYYLGEMQDNQPHGDGYLEYPNGVALVGKFKRGKPAGLILYRSDEEDFYLANIEEGASKPDALIKIDSESLKEEAGLNFANSYFDSESSEPEKIRLDYKFYPCEYEGATFDGKAYGYGKMRCNIAPSANAYLTYEGDFYNNAPHGKGKRESYYEGEITRYSEGSFVQGAFVYGTLWDHGIIYQGGFSGRDEEKSGIGSQQVEDFAKKDPRGGRSWYEGDLYDGLPNGRGIVQDKYRELSFDGFFGQIGYGIYTGGPVTVKGPMRGFYGSANDWRVRLAGYVRFSYTDGRESKGLWCYSHPGNTKYCYEDPKDAYKFAATLGESAYDLAQFIRLRALHQENISSGTGLPLIDVAKDEVFKTLKEDYQLENMVIGAAVVGGVTIVAAAVGAAAPAGSVLAALATGVTVGLKYLGIGAGVYAILDPLTEVKDINFDSLEETKKGLVKVAAKTGTRIAEATIGNRLIKAVGSTLAGGAKFVSSYLAGKAKGLWNKFKIKKPRVDPPDVNTSNSSSVQSITKKELPFVKKTNCVHAQDYRGDSNFVSILEKGSHSAKKSQLRERSLAYEDAIPGTTYDIATEKKIVPALRYINPNKDPRAKNYVKFDGVDLENPKILIDRKYNVTSQAKQIEGFKRQAECLRQNPDYRLRIEVPNEAKLRKARNALQKAELSDFSRITVVIAPEI